MLRPVKIDTTRKKELLVEDVYEHNLNIRLNSKNTNPDTTWYFNFKYLATNPDLVAIAGTENVFEKFKAYVFDDIVKYATNFDKGYVMFPASGIIKDGTHIEDEEDASSWNNNSILAVGFKLADSGMWIQIKVAHNGEVMLICDPLNATAFTRMYVNDTIVKVGTRDF